MAFRSSKKNEIGNPFGVGAVYKRSGFVESDIVELRKNLRKLAQFISILMNQMNQPQHVHCASHAYQPFTILLGPVHPGAHSRPDYRANS